MESINHVLDQVWRSLTLLGQIVAYQNEFLILADEIENLLASCWIWYFSYACNKLSSYGYCIEKSTHISSSFRKMATIFCTSATRTKTTGWLESICNWILDNESTSFAMRSSSWKVGQTRQVPRFPSTITLSQSTLQRVDEYYSCMVVSVSYLINGIESIKVVLDLLQDKVIDFKTLAVIALAQFIPELLQIWSNEAGTVQYRWNWLSKLVRCDIDEQFFETTVNDIFD